MPAEIELASLMLELQEDDDNGGSSAAQATRGDRVAASASTSRAGRYALRVRQEAVAVDRRLLQIERPEELIITGFRSVGNFQVFGDNVFENQPQGFEHFNAAQREAVSQWGRRYWQVGAEEAVTAGRLNELMAMLRDFNMRPSSPEGRAVIEYITAHEVGRFRAFLQQQFEYQHAEQLMRGLHQLLEPDNDGEGMDDCPWARFQITGTVERALPVVTRARGLAAEPPRSDIRRSMTRLDWGAAQQMFTSSSDQRPVTVEHGQRVQEIPAANFLSVPETPATRTASQLGQFGLDTPQTPAQNSSPSQVSMYADTECQSPTSPSTRAAYRARHERVVNEWSAQFLASRDDQRSPSPASTTYEGDENVIGIHEWPVYPGGHGGTDILAGQPGGFSMGLVRSAPSLKRRLTAASFRSSTPRAAKKAKTFPPPQPWNPNAVDTGADMEEEEGAEEEDEEDEEDEEGQDESDDEDNTDEEEAENDAEESNEVDA
ncbi:hypothetical protein ABW21_db0203028 [Orbilia brochopaga]|nr:hypothetical protein ABW21_db0203028 [Drechslerella brochopaga]